MSNTSLIDQAKIKVTEKDFESALRLFNTIIENEPKHKEALYERGVLYTNLKKLDLALFDFNVLIELESDNPFYFACRAFIKTGLKDINGAIQDYQETIRLDPEDAIAYNNLGLLQEQHGYKSAAEKSFEKSNEYLGYSPDRYDDQKVVSQDVKMSKNISDEVEGANTLKVVKSVFSNKKGFKEFINFIKNGFKLKDHDES